MNFKNGEELLSLCKQENQHIYDIAISYESQNNMVPREYVEKKMLDQWGIMKTAIQKGLDSKSKTRGVMIGGEAKKLKKRYEKDNPVCGQTMAKAVSYALGVMEVNVSMGRIVASPTAGSCGVLPAIFQSVQNTHNLSDEEIVNGLFTASAMGIIIAKNASLSGAEGGCQAEVGSAAAMGAGAIVEILGGTPEQALTAGAIALKNLMGLVCDPIAGLVEAPCAKRNAIGTANALIAADMALAGINSIIPFDEVVVAMHTVGRMLPCSLRETAEGGVAATPTGIKLKEQILGKGKK